MAFSVTQALAINPAGTIVGNYTDVNSTLHGFILPPGATIPTALDVPFTGATGTAARAINPTGVITGYYFDANNIGHGFLRIP
jgi:hypothetical protein